MTVDCRLSTVDLYQSRETVQIEVDHSFAGVFDARRERLGDFQKGFLGGSLAFRVAGAGDQARVDRADLRESHAGLDSRLARLARRGDDSGGVAVAFEDRGRLSFEVGLAAQARGEGEEGNEEAGE